MNDKFAYEVKQIDPKLAKSDNWVQTVALVLPSSI